MQKQSKSWPGVQYPLKGTQLITIFMFRSFALIVLILADDEAK